MLYHLKEPGTLQITSHRTLDLVVKLKQLPGTGTGSAHAELVLMAEGIFKHP